jgi:hypothetical protein
MPQFILDYQNRFGAIDLSGGTLTFPTILNLEKAEANRMAVDLFCGDAAGGTGLTVTVQGSADGSTDWTNVGTDVVTTDDILAGRAKVAISPNHFQYLQVTIVKAGSFSAGNLKAYLNSYLGK